MITLTIFFALFVFLIIWSGLTPIAGKVGRLASVIGNTNTAHEFETWTVDLEAEKIPVNGFEKTADANNNYWNDYLMGLCSGEANFAGRWNAALIPTSYFIQGDAYAYNSLFCGVTNSVGFVLTGYCTKIGADNDIMKSAGFKGTFTVNGVTTYPS